MTRSHAHRAATATVALVALALAGCGSSPTTPTSSSAASTATAADPSASASASPSPPAAAAGGKDDPLTGIAGTQDGGICQWVTGEQVGTLAPKPVTGPLKGTITTGDIADGKGKIRRCMTSIGKSQGLILGTITFTSKAALEQWTDAPPRVLTVIPDLPQPASFSVYNTPNGVSQSIQVADGTTVRYITRPGQGEPQAKLVKGKNVPATDHRPALRALYDEVFGG